MTSVRVWLIRLCVLAGVGAACLCGLVLAAGLWLAAPAHAVVGPPPSQLPGFAEVQIPSGSGATLSGWWTAAAQPGAGVVVLMHGVHADRRSMVRRASVLAQHGFGVLLFDLQAHGESTGRHITFGHLEALDALAAVAFVHAHAPGERVGAIGVSLGGAAAVLGPQSLPVQALVLESVYSDIDAALSNRLLQHLGRVIGPVATPVLSRAFELLLPPILGVTPAGLRPLSAMATVAAPVLIASGTVDELTTIYEAEALFARAPQPKRFWPVAGAGHVDLEHYDPEAYWRTVLPFLTKYLRGAPSETP